MIKINSYQLTDVKTLILAENKKLYFFKKSGDDFRLVFYADAYIGINGITKDKKEGDGKTPSGEFQIDFGFGIKNKPETKIKYIKTDSDYYFVSDPESRYYDRLVNIKCVKKDWKSAEHITDYKKEYGYALHINSNPKHEKGNGSAIFLHCKGIKPYTQGCIAIDEEKMLLCFKFIEPDTKIIIK